jgi:hypothetical protein
MEPLLASPTMTPLTSSRRHPAAVRSCRRTLGNPLVCGIGSLVVTILLVCAGTQNALLVISPPPSTTSLSSSPLIASDEGTTTASSGPWPAHTRPSGTPDNRGIFLDGYDVIEMWGMEEGDHDIQGFPTFEYVLDNQYGTYRLWFSSRQNLDLFAINPDRYLPEFGGFCTFAIGVEGVLTSTEVLTDPEPESGITPPTCVNGGKGNRIVLDGKLYLTACGAATFYILQEEGMSFQYFLGLAAQAWEDLFGRGAKPSSTPLNNLCFDDGLVAGAVGSVESHFGSCQANYSPIS